MEGGPRVRHNLPLTAGQTLVAEGEAGLGTPRGCEGGPPTLSVCRETVPVLKQQTCPNSAGMLTETSVVRTRSSGPRWFGFHFLRGAGKL